MAISAEATSVLLHPQLLKGQFSSGDDCIMSLYTTCSSLTCGELLMQHDLLRDAYPLLSPFAVFFYIYCVVFYGATPFMACIRSSLSWQSCLATPIIACIGSLLSWQSRLAR